MSNVIETPVSNDTAAGEMLVQLRAIVQQIRGFGFLGKGTRRQLTTSATLPDPFLLSLAVALDALPMLASASRITSAQLREVVDFSNAFTPVAAELQLIARGLEETIAARRAEAGQEALRTYSTAKSFNRPRDHEQFVPHLAEMKFNLGRGRAKAAPAKPDQPKEGGVSNA